jgi:hypothetical protein
VKSEDAILTATIIYSEEEVLAEFQESCEAEAETPGGHTEQLKRAAEDLCQMLNRQNRAARQRRND